MTAVLVRVNSIQRASFVENTITLYMLFKLCRLFIYDCTSVFYPYTEQTIKCPLTKYFYEAEQEEYANKLLIRWRFGSQQNFSLQNVS